MLFEMLLQLSDAKFISLQKWDTSFYNLNFNFTTT